MLVLRFLKGLLFLLHLELPSFVLKLYSLNNSQNVKKAAVNKDDGGKNKQDGRKWRTKVRQNQKDRNRNICQHT